MFRADSFLNMGTFATHPWLLASKGGKCRVILVPQAQ